MRENKLTNEFSTYLYSYVPSGPEGNACMHADSLLENDDDKRIVVVVVVVSPKNRDIAQAVVVV